MTPYESVFILKPDLDEETVEKVTARITDLITKQEGSVITLEKVGHRRLAYEVKGFHDGFYVVLNFEGTSTTTHELERFFKINEEVIRYLLVRKDEEAAARVKAAAEKARKRREEKEARAAEAKAKAEESGADATEGSIREEPSAPEKPAGEITSGEGAPEEGQVESEPEAGESEASEDKKTEETE